MAAVTGSSLTRSSGPSISAYIGSRPTNPVWELKDPKRSTVRGSGGSSERFVGLHEPAWRTFTVGSTGLGFRAKD